MLSEFKNLRNLDVTSLKVSSLETSSVRYIGDSCFCFRSIYKLIHCFFYGDIYSRDLAPKNARMHSWRLSIYRQKMGIPKNKIGDVWDNWRILPGPIFTNQNGKVIGNATCLVVAAPRCTLQIHMKLSINHQRFHIDAFFTRGFGRAKSSYRNRAILQDCWTSTRISHVS